MGFLGLPDPLDFVENARQALGPAQMIGDFGSGLQDFSASGLIDIGGLFGGGDVGDIVEGALAPAMMTFDPIGGAGAVLGAMYGPTASVLEGVAGFDKFTEGTQTVIEEQTQKSQAAEARTLSDARRKRQESFMPREMQRRRRGSNTILTSLLPGGGAGGSGSTLLT